MLEGSRTFSVRPQHPKADMTANRRAPRVLAALLAAALLAGGVSAVTMPAPAEASAPVSRVTVTTGNATPLLGESTTFDVAFDNIATDGRVGYGPRVDLYLQSTGIDGNDGISFTSATYLGQPVSAQTFTIPALDPGVTVDNGMFLHPVLQRLVPIPAGYHRGDQLVILSLPFGSFTPGQPTIDIAVTAAISPLADLGVSDGSKNLNVLAEPWFRYGFDPLDDPATDDPANSYGTSGTVSFKPVLYRLTQAYLGPESETATGPSYPRAYQVSLDVASGQTITDVNLTQAFTSDIHLVGVTGSTISPAGGTPTTDATDATVHWDSITGTSAAADASFQYSFWVNQFSDPRLGTAVIDATTGAATTTIGTATATNKWLATDPRDNSSHTVACTPMPCTPTTVYDPSDVQVGPYTSTFTERSLAVQKTHDGAGTVVPGDVVNWTVNTEVSDYFAFGSLALTDVVSDGLAVDGSSFQISWPGQAAVPFDPSESSVTIDPATGDSTITLDVSSALDRILGQGGYAIGAAVSTSESGPPTFTITYSTSVLKSYRSEPVPGSRALSPGDTFNNGVTVTGTVATPVTTTPVNTTTPVTNLVQGTDTVTDGSAKTLKVDDGTLMQSVYARNGLVGVAAGTHFAPGDLVTYRIKETLPVESYEKLTVTDFFPLPVQKVTSIAGPVTDLSGGDTVPAVNTISWGPANTLNPPAGEPMISTDSTSNSLKLDFGTQDIATQSGGVVVDLLVTVQISNDPFADGLLLTNQARSAQTNSFAVAANDTALAQFVLAEPDLQITKGIIATTEPGATFTDAPYAGLAVTAPGASGVRWDHAATPITSDFLTNHPLDSSAGNLEAGDLVTYSVVLENTGLSPKGAFDVSVGDAKSDFLVKPGTAAGYNLSVTDGQGNPVSYTGSQDDFFGSGITLADNGSTSGAIPAAATDGSNIVVITYDLQIAGSVPTGLFSSQGIGTLTGLSNTATVNGWSGVQGGPQYAARSDQDKVTVTSKAAQVTKDYIGAEESPTSSKTARVGEFLHYRITVTVPTGHHDNFEVRDQLAADLDFADQVSIDAGGTNASTGLTPSQSGQVLKWDFGTLDNDTGSPATLVIDYHAKVRNSTSVNGGDILTNTAWAGDNLLADQNDLDASVAAAPNLTVVEPTLTLAASTDANFPDSGDTVHWTLTVHNSSAYTAYDVATSTPIPAGVSSPGTVGVAGATGTGSYGSGVVTTDIPSLAAGATATITFATTVGAGNGTASLTSQSVLTWQSIPTAADHTPRTGTGTAPDDYRAVQNLTIAMSGGGIVKTLVSTTNGTTSGANIAIGERAHFQLKVQLPEGQDAAFTIADTLPAGMTVVPGSVAWSAPGFGAGQPNPALTQTPTITASGQNISVPFAAVTLPGDNDATTDYVYVTYDAVLGNSTTNFSATVASKTNQVNSATLTIGTTVSQASQVSLTYVQPQWSLSVTPSAASLRPNDAETYTLKAWNTGAAQTNDATLVFTIPNAAATGTAQTMTGTACGTTPSGYTCAVTTSGNDIVVTYTSTGNNPFAPNASGAQFTATVTATVSANRPDSGTSFPSTFTATSNASSTTSTDYSAVTGPDVNRVITKSANGNVTARIPDPTVSITRSPTTTNVAAGAELTWTVNPTVNTIKTENVTTTVALSAGQAFEAGSAGTGVYDDPTRTITWPATGTLNTGAGITYTFKTLVANPAPTSLTLVSATASVTNLVGGVYLHGTDPNLVNNSAVTSAGVAASPDLLPTMSDGHGPTDQVAPGDSVTYAITARNIGNRDTTTGVVTFTIPEGTTYVSSDPNWTTTTVGGIVTSLTWSGISLAGAHGTTYDETTATDVVVQANPTIRAGLYTLLGTATTSDPNDANAANNVATDTAPFGGNPALAITKTLETAGQLTPGTAVSWLITVTNSGTRGAEGLTVVDTLPSSGLGGYTFSQVSGTTTVTGTRSGTVITWLGGVLEAGATNTYRVGATISTPAPASLEQLVNTATVTENGLNGISSPAPVYPLSSSVTAPVIAAPDDRVTVTDGVTSVAPGASSAYTVTASNYGNQSESGATMELDLPADVTVTNADGGTVAGAAITWSGVSIAGSSDGGTTPGTVTHNPVIKIPSPQPAGTTDKLVTARITTSAEDVVKTDNVATDDDTLSGAPVLAITKTTTTTHPAPGDTVVYTLTVTNSGARGASGVVITDTLPSEVSYVSSTGSGTFSSGTVTWSAGTVAGGGGTASVTVTVKVNAPAAAATLNIVNNAQVCDDGTNGTTARPICGTTSKSLPLNGSPDYAVTLSEGGVTTAAPGASIAYTATVTNVGTQNGAGGVVTVTIPSNVTVTDAGGGDTSTPGRIIYTGVNLGGAVTSPVTAGGTANFAFTLTLNPTQAAGVGTVPVSATSALAADTNATNNSATVSATITGAPNLVVTKTATPSVTPGGTITWVITVTNTGTRGAQNVTLADTLPSGIGTATSTGKLNGSTVSGGTVTGSAIAFSPGTVQVGDSYVYTVIATAGTTTAAGVESLTNTVAFGTIGTLDGTNTSTPSQLAASASTTVVAKPDLGVSVTDNKTSLVIGTDAGGSYVVTLTNTGNENTTTGEATVTLPSWLTVTTPGLTGTPGPSGTTYVFSNRTVSVGTPTMITIPYTVPGWVAAGIETAHASATVTNGSTSGTPNEDGTTGTKSATDDTMVIAVPELVLSSRLTGSATAGGSGSWAISVVNTGTQGATGVEVTSTLPDDLLGSFSATPGATSAVAAGIRTFTWPTFALNPGDPAQQFSVDAGMVTPYPAGTTAVDNVASVADDGTNGPEANLLNNTNTLHVTTADAPNMKVTTSPGTLTASPGATVTIVVSAINQGTADTTSALLTATVPDGYTVVPSSNDTDGRVWNPTLKRFEWSGLSIRGNSLQTLTRTLVLKVDNPQPAGRSALTVDATVTTTNDQVTNTADKSAQTVLTLGGAPDVRVLQSVGDRTAVAGDVVEWTVDVDNIGVRGASGVTVTMTVPGSVDPSTLTTDHGSWDPTTSTITWTIPTLPAGAPKVTFVVDGTLFNPIPLTGIWITSTAAATDDGLNGADTNTANNSANTKVQTGVDLRVTKTLVSGLAVRGQTVTWLISVTNSGPQSVPELNVDERMPDHLSTITYLPSTGHYDQVTGDWTGLTFAPGDTITLTVSALVLQDSPDNRLVNTVKVTPVGFNVVQLATLAATADSPLMSPLAFTGMTLAPWIGGLIVLLLFAGLILLLVGYRRRVGPRHRIN